MGGHGHGLEANPLSPLEDGVLTLKKSALENLEGMIIPFSSCSCHGWRREHMLTMSWHPIGCASSLEVEKIEAQGRMEMHDGSC